MPFNVYLSSPYRQLKDVRGAFLKLIEARSILYKITAMEGYFPEDRRPLEKCLEDVSKCDIYVLIVGDEYGSIASINGKSTGKSYTHLEYEKANEEKDTDRPIERLIFLKTAQPHEPTELTQWREHIRNLGVTTKSFSDLEELPHLILGSLDNYVDRIHRETELKKKITLKDNLNDRIYLCDRKEVEQEFDKAIYENNEAANFFILKGHENDLPRYFFERSKLLFADLGYKWKEIKIQPSISENIKDFSQAEFYINNQIYRELRYEWKKLRNPKDVTFENLIRYMTETETDYLAITWQIENVSFRNEKLGDFLAAFSNKYEQAIKDIDSEKKILFFIVLRYVPAIGIDEEKFYEKANDIPWKNKLPKLSKINIDHIKTWLEENGIEELETRRDDLIDLYFENFNNNADGIYYKDVERGLFKILKLYKK